MAVSGIAALLKRIRLSCSTARNQRSGLFGRLQPYFLISWATPLSDESWILICQEYIVNLSIHSGVMKVLSILYTVLLQCAAELKPELNQLVSEGNCKTENFSILYKF